MVYRAGTSIVKYVFGELVGDLVYAPVWWYTRGFLHFLVGRGAKIRDFIKTLGLAVWIANLGKPMYGQYDLTSKIISFLVRIAVLFFRIIMLALYLVWNGFLIILWLGVPIFAIWRIFELIAGRIS